MAYLITNNKFNPMSFDELLKPLALYKQEYDTAMGAYDQMGQLAGQWEKLGKEDPQSQAYRDYQGYMANLNAAADDLLKNGLNTQVKNRIRGLNQSYKQTITPIEEAWARREAQRGAQQQYLMQNSGSFVERNLLDAETGGIDKFINDTGYTFGNTYKASDLQALAARKFQTLQKELRGINQNGERAFLSDEPGADLHPSMQKMAPYHYSYLVNHGLSSQDVKDWQEGKLKDQALKEALDSIADNIFAETGIGGWEQNGLNNAERAKAMIRGEAVNAIGQTERREFEDKYNMQLALQANEYNNKLRFEREKNGGGELPGPDPLYQPVNLKVQRNGKSMDDILNALSSTGIVKGGRWEYKEGKLLQRQIPTLETTDINPFSDLYTIHNDKSWGKAQGIKATDNNVDMTSFGGFKRVEGGFKNPDTDEFISDADINTWNNTKNHRFYNTSEQLQFPLDEKATGMLFSQYKGGNTLRELTAVDENGDYVVNAKNYDSSPLYDGKTGKYIGGSGTITYDAKHKTPLLHYNGSVIPLPRSFFNSNIEAYLDAYDNNVAAYANDELGLVGLPPEQLKENLAKLQYAKAVNDKVLYNNILNVIAKHIAPDNISLTDKTAENYRY